MKGVVTAAAIGLALAGCAQTRKVFDRERLVRAPELCADQVLPIYFAPGSDALSQPARTLIADAAQRLRGCEVAGVTVTGLADASGTPEANLAVSQRRADRVALALTEEGLPGPTIETVPAGEAGDASAPMRRRAEVLIRARPR